MQLGEVIQAKKLKIHVDVLSSDNFQGREATQTGQKKAANYLAQQLQLLGLNKPATWKNAPSYFQRFPIVKREWKQLYVQIGSKKYQHMEDMIYFGERVFPKQTPLSVLTDQMPLTAQQAEGKTHCI